MKLKVYIRKHHNPELCGVAVLNECEDLIKFLSDSYHNDSSWRYLHDSVYRNGALAQHFNYFGDVERFDEARNLDQLMNILE